MKAAQFSNREMRKSGWKYLPLRALIAAMMISHGAYEASAVDFYWKNGTLWTDANAWSATDGGTANQTFASSSTSNGFLTSNGTAGVIGITTATGITFSSVFVQANGYSITPTNSVGTAATASLTGNISISGGVTLGMGQAAATANRTFNMTGSFLSGGSGAKINFVGTQSSGNDNRLNLSGTLGVDVTVNQTGNGSAAIVAAGTNATITGNVSNSGTGWTALGTSSNGNLTISGVVSGSTGLIFGGGSNGGTGAIFLNAAATNTGETVFNASANAYVSGSGGQLVKLLVDNGISTQSANLRVTAVSFKGGNATTGQAATLDLNGHNQSLLQISNDVANANVFITNSASGSTLSTLTINGSTTSTTAFSIVIKDGSSPIALVRAGTGTTALSAANAYSGGTTILGGGLQIGANSTGSVGSITNSAIGTGGLTLSGGFISSNGSTGRSILNAVNVGANVTLGDVTNNGGLTFAAGTTLLGTSVARTLTVASDATFSGVIGDGGGGNGITKAGAGNLTLGGIDTYAGATTINAGTLTLLSGASIANSSGLTFASGAALNVAGISSYTQAQNVTAYGSGTATITGGTGVNISSRTIDMQNAANAGTLAITATTLTLSGTTFKLDVGSASNDLISLTGAASTGTGNTFNINSLTGATSLTTGSHAYTLFSASGGGLVNGNFALSSSTITVNGISYQLGLSGDSTHEYLDVTALSAAPRNLLWSAAANPASLGAVTDGSGAWANADSANKHFWDPSATAAAAWDSTLPDNVTFGNSNGAAGTVTLSTNITAGTITFAAPSSGVYTIDTVANTLTITGGVIAKVSAAMTGTVLISNNETWTTSPSAVLSVSANLGETAAGKALTFNGGGTVRLSGTNSYSGGTTIAGGTVQVTSSTSLGNASGTATISAATLEVVSSFSSTRNFVLNNSASTMFVDSGVTFTASGAIGDGTTAGTLNAIGPGTLVLTNTGNTYSGGTVISGGTVRVDANGELGNTTGGVTLTAGGTLAVTGSGFTTGRTITVGTGGGIFDIASGATLVVSNPISATGLLTKNDSGTLSLSATGNAFNGGVVVNAGTLAFAQAAAVFSNTMTVASGATISMNVASGVLSFGDGSNPVNETITGTLGITGASRVNFNNGSSSITGPGTIQIDNSAGNVILSNLSGTPGATVSTAISLNPANVGNFVAYIGGTTGGNTVSFNGAISGATSVQFANSSSGTGGGGNVFLGATNSWTGSTSFATTGTVSIGINNALPTATDVVFNARSGQAAASTLNLNGFSQQIASLATGAGNAATTTITNNPLSGSATSTLTISGISGSTTYSGVIADGTAPVALYKAGGNTQVLTGANAFAGGTIIAGGVLVAGGSSALGTGGVTVSGGTLASLATGANIGGNVTVSSAGVIAPGNAAAGQMTISGNLHAYSGSSFSIVLGAASNSSLISASNITMDNGVTLNLSGAISTGTYEVMTYSGTYTGGNPFSTINAAPIYSVNQVHNGNEWDLVITAAPLTWNAAGTGTTTDGAGTWTNGSGTNFNTGGTSNVVWDNTFGATVTFGTGGAGGNVALGSNITASSIIFAPVTSPYTISPGSGPFALTLTTGFVANNSASVSANVMMTSSQTWTATTGAILNVSGSIGQSTNSRSLTFNGPGTLVLGGSNSYSGGTVVAGGTVSISSDTNLGAASGVTLSGGALQTTADFTSARTLTVTGAGGTIDTAGHTWTVSVSSGNALVDSAAMTVTGGGTFAVNAGGASGTVSLSGPVTIDGNSTLKITSPNQQFLGSTTIGSGSRFVLDTNGVLRSISSSGGTNNTYSGAGFFELRDGAIFTASGNGANTAVISAPVTLSGTTAYFGATNTNSMSITGGIGGTGAIVFASTISANGGGAGIVNVGGTGTYAGNSIINNAASGAVRIVNDNALSTASGAVWGNGGTSNVGFLDLNGSSQQFASIATNLGGTATAGGIVNSSATGSTLTISGSATTTFAAPIGAVVTENVGGGNTLSTNTNVSLVLNAANTGTLHLTGASPYTGSTIINGGTLAVDGALSGTSGISVGSGGTLAGVGAVNAAATVALAGGALAMSGGSVGAVHVTADSSWSGSATAASITVDSGKTLNMSGTATVTTEIDVAGSRLVNNGTLHATVDVTAGGVVHGSGSFDTLNVGNGGSVSPGNSPGTMTSANTTWDNGGTYVWEINHLGSSFGDQTPAGTDPGWDKWDAGLLTIHSGFTVDVTSLTAGNSAGLLSGFDPSSSYEWLIATRTSGDFASDLGSIGLNLSGFANSYSGTFSLASGGGGSELFLDYTYTAVPEPGTLLLGFLATSSFAWRLRRRSTRVADTLGDETSLDA